MAHFRFAVIEFLNQRDVRFVSRHGSAERARSSASKHDLNQELNVIELHTGEMPGVGDKMSRTEVRERFRSVPLDTPPKATEST